MAWGRTLHDDRFGRDARQSLPAWTRLTLTSLVIYTALTLTHYIIRSIVSPTGMWRRAPECEINLWIIKYHFASHLLAARGFEL